MAAVGTTDRKTGAVGRPDRPGNRVRGGITEMRRVVVVAVLIAAMLALAPQTSTSAADLGAEAAFTNALNGLRVSKGVAALGTHPMLTAKAESWAAQMAAANNLTHSNLADGISVYWTKL